MSAYEEFELDLSMLSVSIDGSANHPPASNCKMKVLGESHDGVNWMLYGKPHWQDQAVTQQAQQQTTQRWFE